MEQKRRGRTFPAVVNGLTAAQAQAQGLIIEDSSDNEDLASTNDESLFLPDGSAIAESALQPVTNGAKTQAPLKIQEKSSEGPSGNPSFLQPSVKPSSFSDAPTSDTSTANFFGKPSISTSSQPSTQPFFPQSNFLDKPKNRLFSDPSTPEATASPFGKTNHADSRLPSFNFAKPFTEQPQSNLNPTTPSTSSIFNVQPPSTSDLPLKVNFGKSPLFNFPGPGNAVQAEKADDNIDFSAKPVPKEAESKIFEKIASPSESVISNPTSNASTPVLFPSAPALATLKGTYDQSSRLSFPSSVPSSAASSLRPKPSTEQLDKPASPRGFNFTQASLPSTDQFSAQPSGSSISQQPDNATKPPRQSPFQPATSVANLTFQSSASSVLASQHPRPIASSSEAAATESSDPRPAVLDALAEGLLMEDQGLLEQFIEYAIGPLVHEAFREVEEERSWKRASQWLMTNHVSRQVKLITCRGDANRSTLQQVSPTLEGHSVEAKTHAQRKGKESHLCEVDARIGQVVEATAWSKSSLISIEYSRTGPGYHGSE